MKEAKVVKPTKEILGIEPKIGDEWDAGSVPFGCAYRRVRVTVRREEKGWTVFCVAYKGAEQLLGDYGFTKPSRCVWSSGRTMLLASFITAKTLPTLCFLTGHF
jgi:hypothetical protein